MPMIAFFPWFTIAEDTSVGAFDLFRYEREVGPFGTTDLNQAVADTILGHYFPRPLQSLVTSTIVSIHGHSRISDLDESERGAIFDFSELVAFSGLSSREFFSNIGRYCNRDNFQIVIQGFADATSGALITTRRRDGHFNCYLTSDRLRIDKPEHVSLGPIGTGLDIGLLNALLTAKEEIDDWERFTESILSFNLANTDRSNMSEHVEAILIVSAFERLLNCRHGKEDDLAQHFLDLFPSECSTPGECPRLASATNRLVSSRPSLQIREIWIRDFFRVRGALAHGSLQPRYPAIWGLREHLLLGSYLFPHFVRLLLAKHKLYSLTSADRRHIKAFERLACEHLFTQTGDDSDPRWPWTNVFDQILSEELEAKAIEYLKSTDPL